MHFESIYNVKQQKVESRPLTDHVKSSSARKFVMGVHAVLPVPLITCAPNPYVNVHPAFTEGKRPAARARSRTFMIITSS